MKPSRYNCFYMIDDAPIAYNTFTTELVSLTGEQFAGVRAFYTELDEAVFERPGLAGLRDALAGAGMLVPDGVDEQARVAATYAEARGTSRHLSLTLVPTLACNFRCAYCFSYARPSRMSAEVQAALLRFADARLPESDGFSIHWYGGEPTLCLDIIERLSAQLHDAAAGRGVCCEGDGIVTNGYTLTRPVAERLKAAGIGTAQVTLDGAAAIHDARRPLAGDAPTFGRILGNLCEVHDLLKISVRVNVDRANADTALGALDALAGAGLAGKVHPYFAHVRPYSEACRDIGGACLTDREFSVLEMELTKQALLRGFTPFHFPESLVTGACGACHSGSYVVSPDGLLFRCWAEASCGADFSIGDVFTDRRTPVQEANLRLYRNWNPLVLTQCADCRLLPVCMGGCPHLRLRGNGQGDCSPWRYVLGESLGLRIKLEEQARVLAGALSETVRAPEAGGGRN